MHNAPSSNTWTEAIAATQRQGHLPRSRRQIELLQEYRTRLIADVVTGKLNVREAAAQLPDEGDDQEQMEESGTLTDGIPEGPYDPDESVAESAMASEVNL